MMIALLKIFRSFLITQPTFSLSNKFSILFFVFYISQFFLCLIFFFFLTFHLFYKEVSLILARKHIIMFSFLISLSLQSAGKVVET